MKAEGKKILVTGASGMLAREVAQVLSKNGALLLLTDLNAAQSPFGEIVALDITRSQDVERAVERYEPDILVNCAAYTRVDDAESDYRSAFAVNAEAVGNLARAAKKVAALLVHVSSDYVFGGDTSVPRQPFSEEAHHHPCGLYGYSKHFGDCFAREILENDHLIVRTSWLHGLHGPNFIDTMLRIGKERPVVRVVDDQFGSPTWAPWLAEIIHALLVKETRGTIHASSEGALSWFDLASELFAQAGYDVEVQPQTTEELGRAAPRPAYSVLSKDKLRAALGSEMCMDWREAVAAHLTARSEHG